MGVERGYRRAELRIARGCRARGYCTHRSVSMARMRSVDESATSSVVAELRWAASWFMEAPTLLPAPGCSNLRREASHIRYRDHRLVTSQQRFLLPKTSRRSPDRQFAASARWLSSSRACPAHREPFYSGPSVHFAI